MMKYISSRGIFTLTFIICLHISGYSQKTIARQDSARLARFYTTIRQPLFWFNTPKNVQKADQWLKVIKSREVRNLGFFTDNTLTGPLQSSLTRYKKLSDQTKQENDKQISALVLRFIKFLNEGEAPFEYDAYHLNHDSIYIAQLINSQRRGSVETTIADLDCKAPDYKVLKKYLNDSVSDKTSMKAKKIWLSMNYIRYLSANDFNEKIIVNIPAATAVYYRDNLPSLEMRVVPGRKEDPTPTMASYITSIVTFPPWKVPNDISVNEILPKVQQDITYLEQNNFEVVDKDGNVLDDSEIHWKELDKDNFPYFFRQATGPDNSLGMLKFNLKNPLSIFLHATSYQGAFAKESRFLSHGCVRLEKPYDLANAILRGKIDRQELANAEKGAETKEYKIDHRVATFLIYMPAVVKGPRVIFLNDVYGLIQ